MKMCVIINDNFFNHIYIMKIKSNPVRRSPFSSNDKLFVQGNLNHTTRKNKKVKLYSTELLKDLKREPSAKQKQRVVFRRNTSNLPPELIFKYPTGFTGPGANEEYWRQRNLTDASNRLSKVSYLRNKENDNEGINNIRRCANGTRKNKKTGKCDKIQRTQSTKSTPKKRCERGTRKSKSTGKCENHSSNPNGSQCPICKKNKTLIPICSVKHGVCSSCLVTTPVSFSCPICREPMIDQARRRKARLQQQA